MAVDVRRRATRSCVRASWPRESATPICVRLVAPVCHRHVPYVDFTSCFILDAVPEQETVSCKNVNLQRGLRKVNFIAVVQEVFILGVFFIGDFFLASFACSV